MLGGGRPLGAHVVAALRRLPKADRVIAIERDAAMADSYDDELALVSWSPDHRAFAEYLRKEEIDTVVDCALVADRTGATRSRSGADVISAMCVGAAVAHADSPVRSWVLASSTAFYPVDSYAPLLYREDATNANGPRPESESIAEAEEYARSVALRRPHVNVATLRLQELVGPGLRGPIASLFTEPSLPRCPGFDPAVQLLHLEDAVGALTFAVEVELAGVYNVASRGLLRWGEVLEARGGGSRTAVPIPLRGGARRLLSAFGFATVDSSVFDWLRFGNAVDVAKLERAGWLPRRDQDDCLEALARPASR